ncbi:MAG: beta-glucosidase [Candidatus Ornithospirochaeta sp.]
MDIKKIVSSMTLEEKIAYCTGKDFWHTKDIKRLDVPSIMVSDGPNGLRCQKDEADMLGVNVSLPATCFPSSVTAAQTWDIELIEKQGKAIGKEAKKENVSVVLGPGCNIKRNPLGGRNFEYYSEDPILAGEIAASWIQGVEKEGVGASLKHFAANSQEYKRLISDSIMDERTLREIYLSAFERAVKKGNPSTVMCSYNKINGVYSSDNKSLLTDILRKEWGWNGCVITDWGALHDRIEAYKAGCDLSMPGGSKYMEDATLKAVKEGRLSEKRIDETVERILSLVEKSGKTEKEEVDWNEHHRVALKIAEKGAVLLKNEDKILPLKEDEDIALFGFMAGKMRYQGTGSSHINPKNLIEPIEFFKDKPWIAGVDENGNFDECAIKEITEGAKKHRVIIAFVGLPESYESEAFDRDTMKMPSGYLKLLEVLTEANPNTVAVLFSGSVVDMSWENSVKAILYMGLPGEAGGEALYNLIYGKAVPGGKLAETWPLKYSDVPSSDSWGKVNAEYREGIYVGYRYYDKAKMKVRYPFGYGLSYTEFEYSNLIVEGRKVSLTVKNVGEYDGDEVVELYIKNPEKNGYRSLRELRGFSRVRLNRGEEKRVSFTLTDRDFSIYDGGWRAIGGDYTIEIGSSSRDIRLSALIHIEGDEPRRELDGSWYCDPVGKPSKEEFERLIGRSVEEYKPRHKGEYTMDNSCMEMKEHSLIMKIQYRVTENIISKSYGGKKDYSDPGFKMMMVASADCPLRTSIINSGGTLTERMARSFLLMANGKCIKGILSFISPFLGAK